MQTDAPALYLIHIRSLSMDCRSHIQGCYWLRFLSTMGQPNILKETHMSQKINTTHKTGTDDAALLQLAQAIVLSSEAWEYCNEDQDILQILHGEYGASMCHKMLDSDTSLR